MGREELGCERRRCRDGGGGRESPERRCGPLNSERREGDESSVPNLEEGRSVQSSRFFSFLELDASLIFFPTLFFTWLERVSFLAWCSPHAETAGNMWMDQWMDES